MLRNHIMHVHVSVLQTHDCSDDEVDVDNDHYDSYDPHHRRPPSVENTHVHMYMYIKLTYIYIYTYSICKQ